MDAELQAAAAEYRTQLSSLEQLLAVDPDNSEVKEVYEQLLEALSYTLATLDELQGVDATAAVAPEGGGGDENGACGGGDGDGSAGDAAAAVGGGDGDGGVAAAAAGVRPRGGAPNNARMHPANLYYRQEPDFAALSRQYDELRPYVSTDAAGRAHLDSTSWEATRALTAVLLRHDLGLRWWLPEGQLVPPVPNRANYIHWINDLLHLSAPPDSDGPVRGLDIGCGANFIYCLLGAVLYGWKMVGVDVTQVAVRCCRQLMKDNPQVAPLLEIRDLSYMHPELQGPDAAAPAGTTGPGGGRRGRKQVAHEAPGWGAADSGGGGGGSEPAAAADESMGTAAGAGVGEVAEGAEGAEGTAATAEGVDERAAEAVEAAEGVAAPGILLPAFLDADETFAFTICNPPFFESMQEAAQNPNTAFGGTAAEMVCPGGELAFVLQMLVESEALADRVHWFSTMVGKKNTLKALRKELHARHVTALRTTELAQGKTSRWAVAWSWRVDPNKASQPLLRLEAPVAPTTAVVAELTTAAAASGATAAEPAAPAVRPKPAAAPSLAAAGMPLLPRRHVSFTVQQGGSLNTRTMLQEVRRLLQEGGCERVEVDTAAWTMTWPLQVGPFRAGTEGEGERDLKRPRQGPALEGDDGGGSWAGNMKVRLRIAQQQRGRFELVATIPNDAPDAAARAFAGRMLALKAGLGSLAGR